MASQIRPKVMLLHLRSRYEQHVCNPKASQSRDINQETQELHRTQGRWVTENHYVTQMNKHMSDGSKVQK